MDNMTLLTYEQIFGDEPLDIIKKYGTKCAVTDFSILLGISYADDIYTNEGKETEDKKERTGWWWTKTSYPGYSSGARVVDDDGHATTLFTTVTLGLAQLYLTLQSKQSPRTK